MVWSGSWVSVHGGPAVLNGMPVVLVVDPWAAAGIELAHPGNSTVRVKDPTVHVHDEKVTLEAAPTPVPAGAAGVRTAVTMAAGPRS
jgi:hypothetical protein